MADSKENSHVQTIPIMANDAKTDCTVHAGTELSYFSPYVDMQALESVSE